MGERERQLGFRDLEIQEQMIRCCTLAADLDRRLKDVAYSIDRKDLAMVNDISYSYLSEMLNTNGDQKPFKTPMIPSLLLLAPDLFAQEVLGPLCDLAGYEMPEKKRLLTPEEELKKLKRRIREHGLEPLFKD